MKKARPRRPKKSKPPTRKARLLKRARNVAAVSASGADVTNAARLAFFQDAEFPADEGFMRV